MPAESKKPGGGAEATPAAAVPAPPKKSTNTGKAAIAKVTLLDGSELEVSIDVSEPGYFTILCASLRFVLNFL